MVTRQERPPCPSGRYWTIKQGDSLYSIARQLGLAVNKIIRLNPGLNPRNLIVGSLICLPPEEPPCDSGLYWRVAAGDTLYIIAREANTTVRRLLELNPHVDPANLQIGQSICLPG